MGIIILILICAGLAVALFWDRSQTATQNREALVRINYFSNQVEETSAQVDDLRKVNILLTNDLDARRAQLVELTNKITEISGALSQTEETLEAAREQVARRDARIADLESQNEALDQRTIVLSTAITNLNLQIEDTRQRLASSEGEKVFLEKELQRLMAEKAELERQFNDLAILRAQVAKLKAELNISRRLEWIRQGLFARGEMKGAEQLIQKEPLTPPPLKQPAYDLNVEVSADGTVRVIPPVTNNPAATNAPPAR